MRYRFGDNILCFGLVFLFLEGEMSWGGVGL